MFQTIASYASWFIGGYFIVSIVLASIVAVYQEYKIWKPKSLPTLNVIGCIKVFLFNVLWMVLCFIGSIVILIRYVITFGNTNIAHDGNRIVENFVARFCMQCFFGTVHIIGIEHLPPLVDDTNNNMPLIPAPVYIANHYSQLDIGAMYYINRRMKWIAKQSVLYVPGVGLVMYLSKHVLIQRTGKNKNSVSNLFEMSNDAVQSGIPMFVFPQGTRCIDQKLPFKNGAFIIAQTNRSPIVPISVDVPLSNQINTLYPLNLLWGIKPPVIQLTIHPQIPVTGKENMDELKDKCMNIIYSVLPKVETNKDK